jgi:RimJ/RimL family protein N-acetyltransferase
MAGFWPIGRQAWAMSRLPHEMRLEGERVVLRDWRDEDAPALEPVCGEWDVCGFTSVPSVYSEAEARAWVERQRRKRAAGTVLALAIQGRDDDRALGNVNLAGLAEGRREAEIGYWLVPEARGRGLVTEAVSLLIDWGFANLGLERSNSRSCPRTSPPSGWRSASAPNRRGSAGTATSPSTAAGGT